MNESVGVGFTPQQRRIVAVMAALVAAVAIALVVFGPAGAQNDPEGAVIGSGADYGADHITVLDDDGRFTGPGTWPPRPKSATTGLISDHATLAAESESAVTGRSSRTPSDLAERSALADPAVIEALGDRYWFISSYHPLSTDVGATKGAVDPNRTETVYFSASNNQTVIVESQAEQVTRVSAQSPTDGQPPLARSERDAAITIAREHWQEFGADRIDGLEGYAIEAYPPEGGNYDFRAVYVSFHADVDSEPELITWVNLTDDSIVKAQVAR